jgi:ribonucleoside-diphosphate reductase beta chain
VGLFDKRLSFKPFEYPELVAFKEGVQHSYWLVSEWTFEADVQDFNTRLSEVERSAVKNTLLAISQIEVSVKKFWTKIGDRFPKPEVEQVGVVFGESEVRHADAYSHLLHVLSLNDDFEQLLTEPVIQRRVDYLQKYLKGAADNGNENYTLTLTLFSIFIENVSLFSQFLIVKAFNKYRNQLKDIDNVVQATAKEERLHALFGVRLIEIVKEENPDWFNDDFYVKLERACKKAYEAEVGIIDWIFQKGELPFLPKAVVLEFTKDRFNQSMVMVGGRAMFEVDAGLLSKVRWFDEEESVPVAADFFHKKPVTYSKKMQSITTEDLF